MLDFIFDNLKHVLCILILVSRTVRYPTSVLTSASFIILLGVVLLLSYPDPNEDLAFWFGAGIVTYGLRGPRHAARR